VNQPQRLGAHQLHRLAQVELAEPGVERRQGLRPGAHVQPALLSQPAVAAEAVFRQDRQHVDLEQRLLGTHQGR